MRDQTAQKHSPPTSNPIPSTTLTTAPAHFSKSQTLLARMGRGARFDVTTSLARDPPPPPLSTWQCHLQDGSVSRNGAIVAASRPCSWELAKNSWLTQGRSNVSSCAGAELLAAIERREVDRRNLQVVVVQHAEDISWSDSFAAVRTVYHQQGTMLHALPRTRPSTGAGPTAPEAASVALPNVGKEQHAYLAHIVRNYDSLADWTVFLHGKMPTCGFFLADPNLMGNHLLTNVSVLDYFQAEGNLFMPLTGRTNHNLTLSSFRSTFADGLVPRPRVSRPVSAYPRYGDAGNDAEEGGGDRWLEWELNDLPKLAKELTLKQGALRAEEMLDFDAFFRRVVGREPPAVLHFAQGAQFSASRATLRSTPKETYRWILELVEAGHLEVTFYLEMSWLYVLHGALETEWDASVDGDEEVPPHPSHHKPPLQPSAAPLDPLQPLLTPLRPSPGTSLPRPPRQIARRARGQRRRRRAGERLARPRRGAGPRAAARDGPPRRRPRLLGAAPRAARRPDAGGAAAMLGAARHRLAAW